MSLFELQRLDGKSRGLDVDTVKDALRNLFMALDFLHTEANVTHGGNYIIITVYITTRC